MKCPPRWGSARSAAPTRGDGVATVGAALGWELFDWQRHVCDVALEVVDGRYRYRTVGVAVGRQNGKTALAAARIGLELLQAGHQVAFTAQDRNMARAKWEEHVELIVNSSLGKRVKRVSRANGQEAVHMLNGSVYRIVTPNRKGSRGLSLDLVVIDEALTHDLEVIAALQPTLATKPDGQLWLLSNAGDSRSTMLAHYRDLGHAGLDGDEGRLAWFEWAPADDEFDHLDPAVWRQAIPTLLEAAGVNEAAVAEAAATSDPAQFTREFLNVWPAVESVAVIPLDDWQKLERPDVPIGDQVVLGVDIGPNRDRATIAACGRNGPWTPVELVDARGFVGWLMPRLLELWEKWKAPVVVDAGGPAANVIPELEQAGVTVIPVQTREYTRACAAIFDAVTSETICHLGDRMLDDAVAAAAKRPVGDSWVWNRRSEMDMTPLIAATLAHWGCVAQKTAASPRVY